MKTINQRFRKAMLSGLVLLFGVSACADLEVANQNDPDARRALSQPGDVESLMAGAFGQWWNGSHSVNGAGPIIANQTFMWSAWPANFGMVHYSGFPRVAVENEATHQFYGNMLGYTWTVNYRALSAIAQGFVALEDPEVAAGLGQARVNRLRAYGRFIQGMSHAHLAMLYHEAYIIDETVDVLEPQVSQPYQDVMAAAMGYFQQAIDLANAGGFDAIPSAWMSVGAPVTSGQLARLAHSYRARYRANVARNPAERDAVDWPAVIADVNAGIQGTWFMSTDYFGSSASISNYMAAYMSLGNIGWQQASYFVFGMADQSGMYQDWLSYPHADKHPNFADGSPRLIITPDLRFPQGATLADQEDNPGMPHTVTGDDFMRIGPLVWGQPARGSHRWSYYIATHMEFHRLQGTNTPTPEITMAEMDLLRAEGLYRSGGAADLVTVAELINNTRVPAGLNPTDALGTNTSCVPRLPDDSCGDLLEMLKWEKRMETMLWGVHANSWYFDGRGWGDLYAGTATSLPVPCLERELLLEPCNTFGGEPGAVGSAPVSSYAYPFES